MPVRWKRKPFWGRTLLAHRLESDQGIFLGKFKKKQRRGILNVRISIWTKGQSWWIDFNKNLLLTSDREAGTMEHIFTLCITQCIRLVGLKMTQTGIKKSGRGRSYTRLIDLFVGITLWWTDDLTLKIWLIPDSIRLFSVPTKWKQPVSDTTRSCKSRPLSDHHPEAVNRRFKMNSSDDSVHNLGDSPIGDQTLRRKNSIRGYRRVMSASMCIITGSIDFEQFALSSWLFSNIWLRGTCAP